MSALSLSLSLSLLHYSMMIVNTLGKSYSHSTAHSSSHSCDPKRLHCNGDKKSDPAQISCGCQAGVTPLTVPSSFLKTSPCRWRTSCRVLVGGTGSVCTLLSLCQSNLIVASQSCPSGLGPEPSTTRSGSVASCCP